MAIFKRTAALKAKAKAKLKEAADKQDKAKRELIDVILNSKTVKEIIE